MIGIIGILTALRVIVWLINVYRSRGNVNIIPPLMENDQLGGGENKQLQYVPSYGYDDDVRPLSP